MSEMAISGGPESLGARILRFNLAPAMYLDETWYGSLPHGQVCRAMAKRPEARARVSRYLLEALGLEDRFFHDFREPRARLALLEPEQLESLFLYVGATLRSYEFANELDGRRIAHLRQSLGASVLEYATHRAAFAGSLVLFGYEPKLADARLRLILIGAAYALSPRATAEPAYRRRIALMLPQGLAEFLDDGFAASAGEPSVTALPAVVRRIMREFLPKWLPLFA